jgi:hypothetical protein
MKTHFEEDVRFAYDCDIALTIWEFAGLRLVLASLSPTTLIDGDKAVARRQNRC